jgi:Hydantoinase B/oxoprolinase
MARSVIRDPPEGSTGPGNFTEAVPDTGGSTHSPDITAASPVFHDGEPVGFVANIAPRRQLRPRNAGGGKNTTATTAACPPLAR